MRNILTGARIEHICASASKVLKHGNGTGTTDKNIQTNTHSHARAQANLQSFDATISERDRADEPISKPPVLMNQTHEVKDKVRAR